MVETKEEKRARRRKEKEELLAYKIEQGIAMWNPAEHENATKDPYKTLFVSRIVGFIFKPFNGDFANFVKPWLIFVL